MAKNALLAFREYAHIVQISWEYNNSLICTLNYQHVPDPLENDRAICAECCYFIKKTKINTKQID